MRLRLQWVRSVRPTRKPRAWYRSPEVPRLPRYAERRDSGGDPLRVGHRPATGGAVLVMNRPQLCVHVGRAVHRAPLRVLTI
jgi:hypothetical protein